ncbi:hypothetical protein ACFE04_003600 [Oxalis oulophora]
MITGACIRRDGELDRLSELPECILHHILSFLTLMQVKQVCVLSKTWIQVSTTHPILKFNGNFFDGLWDKYKVWKLINQFNIADQIIKTLCKKRLSIHEIELDVYVMSYYSWSSSNYFDQWVQRALDCNVKVLTLSFGCGHEYTLPRCVLLAKYVVALTLKRCKFPPVSRDFKTTLSSLKKLTFQSVKVTGLLPQNLFTNVEYLTLLNCHGITMVNISGPAKLKKLDLSMNPDLKCVHIEALSLTEASFGYHEALEVFDIRHCKNLKRISMGLTKNIIVTKWLDEVLSFYHALETLHLCCCFPKNAKISSTSLKTLEIHFDFDLAALELDTPKLSEFSYFGRLVDFSSKAPALTSSSVTFVSSLRVGETAKESEYLKEMNFLSQLNGCDKVKVTSYSGEKLFIFPRNIRERMISPLHNVKNLEICTEGKVELDEELIDSLFWISPHPEIRLLRKCKDLLHGYCNYTFKFYKEKTSYEEESSTNTVDQLVSFSKVYRR